MKEVKQVVNTQSNNKNKKERKTKMKKFFKMSGMTISNVLSITDQVMKNDPLYEGINSVSGEVITLANYVIVGEISFP